MKLTEKQAAELKLHRYPEPIRQNWRRAGNPQIASALVQKGLLKGIEFSERDLHDTRRMYWIEYQLTKEGLRQKILLKMKESVPKNAQA